MTAKITAGSRGLKATLGVLTAAGRRNDACSGQRRIQVPAINNTGSIPSLLLHLAGWVDRQHRFRACKKAGRIAQTR